MKSMKQTLKTIRHGLKQCALWSYVHIHAPLRNQWRARSGNCHVTVLLYHRICKESVDNASVTPSQFFDQLSILKRHYDMIDMKTFLSEAGRVRTKAAVVISFDDDYQGNYDAAKILRMENVPTTFFVSTGILGEKNPCPFGVRLSRRLPTSPGNQVREIPSCGFRISNHSINHCNTGKVSIENSAHEVQKMVQDNVPRIGDTDDEQWYSFSFRRPDTMQNAVMERLDNTNNIDNIDNIDSVDCFSTEGDVSEKNFNRHDIARQAVSHQFSELAFRALVEGYRIR